MHSDLHASDRLHAIFLRQVPPKSITLSRAEAECASSDACRGFTFSAYERVPPPTTMLKCSFKTVIQFVADTGEQQLDLWQVM